MTCAAYYNAGVRLPTAVLLAGALAVATGGCGASTSTTDLGVTLDMHVPGATQLATAQTSTHCLASDGSFLYWSDGTPAIMKVAIGGGDATQLVAGGDANGCVAADGSGVYYFEAGKLMKATPSGGGAVTLATGQAQLRGAPLVAAGGFVYWITDVYGDVDAYNGKNAIVRIASAGGAVQVVSALVVGNPGGLAVDDSNVYYSDQSGLYARALAATATATPFGQSALHDNALAVGGGRLAMTEISAIGSGDLAVFRLDGMMRAVVSPALAQPLAVDDRFVYANGSGSFQRFAVDGSGGATLWPTGARAAVLSPTTLYFTDGGGIYALPK